MAGSDSVSRIGGGVNYLCMHPEPQFPEGVDDTQNENGASLFGVEYKNSGSVDKNNDEDAGCAVCEHETASLVYVQWGRKECSNGHHTEYYGLIMAHKTKADTLHNYQSKSICVDWERSPSVGSYSANEGGGLLYTTEFAANIGEYKKGHELSCALCSVEDAVVYTRWGSKLWISNLLYFSNHFNEYSLISTTFCNVGGDPQNVPMTQQCCTRAS